MTVEMELMKITVQWSPSSGTSKTVCKTTLFVKMIMDVQIGLMDKSAMVVVKSSSAQVEVHASITTECVTVMMTVEMELMSRIASQGYM